MLQKQKEIVGVSITEKVIRLAHMRCAQNDLRLLNVVRRDLREVAEEEHPAVMKAALQDLNVKSPQTVCVIDSGLVTTKNIEIPSLDAEEIHSIIDLQAGRHTPYSREEILVSYVTVGIFQRNYTKVLLVIVNRDVIKKQLQLCQSAGMRVEKIVFAPEVSAQFYAQIMGVKAEDKPVGIIDITNHTTNFIVEYNQTVATSRSISLGMQHIIKEGDGSRQKLIEEIARSVEAYQNEDIHDLPETFVLTSDDAKIQEMAPILQEKLRANIKIVPYLEHITGSQTVMVKMVSEYNDDSFLDVIAGVAKLDRAQVDLTPDEVKVQHLIEERMRQGLRMAISIIILLMLVAGIFISKIYFKTITLSKVSRQYQETREAAEALDQIMQRTQIIKSFVESRMESLDVIRELYRLIPNEIYVDNVNLTEEGVIHVNGISEESSRIYDFVNLLEASEVFKNAEAKSTVAKKDRGKNVVAFQIEFRLERAEAPQIASPEEEGLLAEEE